MSSLTDSIIDTAAKSVPRPSSLTRTDRFKWFCLMFGIAILIASTIVPVPAGLDRSALKMLAVMITVTLWWITEAFPVAVTALLIPVMVHALRIMPMQEAVRESFGNTLIPFMIGVLGLSAAFTASGLGKRLACHLLQFAGTDTRRVVGGYLWMSFLICMFVDPLAVVAMMLPLVLGVLKAINAVPGKTNFGKALMMAIIFGAILGGSSTPAGVSSNVVTVAFLTKMNIKVSFVYWMAVATPIAVSTCFITWWLILRIFPPEIKFLPTLADTSFDIKAMGRWSTKEKTTLTVFLCAVTLWMTSDLTQIPSALISLLIVAGITLPVVGVFRSWKELHIEWGGVILLVGGFVVGVAAAKTGLASWLVQKGLGPMVDLPRILQPSAIVLIVAADSLGFSSFGTTASVNVPLVMAYAQHAGLPLLAMAMVAGLASSVHFILVTQSPSIVLPYAAGYFSFRDLAKIGLCVTLVSTITITVGIWIAGMPAGVPLRTP
jgi:solute carrier family 13 (sodium-dependent dicarboxylate transporter), member 2/3/5